MRSQTKKQLGRWGLLFVMVLMVTVVLYSAVSLPPAVGQAASADSALLTKQLEFMLKMNSAFLGFLGTVGVLLTWFFKNNLDDAKEVAGDMVRRELDSRVKAIAKEEFAYLERTILSERIVGDTLVNYFLPEATVSSDAIREIKLLEIRGFKRPVRFCTTERQLRSRTGDVTVLDLQHRVLPSGKAFSEISREEKKVEAEQLIVQLFNLLPESVVLVVYFQGQIDGLFAIKPKHKTQYLLAANNPVTLLGHVANGAYVAYGDRIESNA